jgi:DNA (cytosine-5)-methyltransferase 1
MSNRAIYAADLFSGCGGLTLGLKKAGLSVCVAVENDSRVIPTYSANHPSTHVIENDIRSVTGDDLLAKAPRGRIDVLVGCAPCQGFSSLTRKHKREDPRNELVLEMARLIEEVEPRAIAMENVPGLAQHGRHLLDEFMGRLKKLGYYSEWRILQMADYGVPQNRRRLVLTAGRGFVVSLPEATHHKKPQDGMKAWITLREAIGRFKAPPRLSAARRLGGPAALNWHVVRDLKPVTRERLRAAMPGETWQSVPEHLRPECHQGEYIGFTNVYQRMTWDQLPVTMTSGCTVPAKGRFGHPDRRRTTISVREAATLQSFPARYKFVSDHIDHVCHMIGNAVPPLFGQRLGRRVTEALRTHDKSVG